MLEQYVLKFTLNLIVVCVEVGFIFARSMPFKLPKTYSKANGLGPECTCAREVGKGNQLADCSALVLTFFSTFIWNKRDDPE